MNWLKNLNKDKKYIFVCVGLPLSGKTTCANIIKKILGNCLSFNKVDFYKDYFSNDIPNYDLKFLENLEYNIIDLGIKYNKNIIIDDCNFDVIKLNKIIDYIYNNINSKSYIISIIDFTNINFDIVYEHNKQLNKYSDLTYYIMYGRLEEIKNTIKEIYTKYNNINIYKYNYE